MSDRVSKTLYQLATPGVRGLQPYAPGKPIAELEREYGVSHTVKLASNENPLGMSERARQAIVASLNEAHLYPDGNAFELKRALSEYHDVPSDQITMGNGSNDVLEIIARSFVTASDEVMYSQYAFAVYPIVTQAIGAKHRVVPAKNWGHDLEAMAAAVSDKTRLIFIANPNNPTGTLLTDAEIQGFLQRVPATVIVVLDEAYHDYIEDPAYASAEKYLAEYPNLIVTRTFSKAYGLAGLRVGYGLSHPIVANSLNRVRQPFNVNVPALAAAQAALDDQEFVTRTRRLNQAGKQQLQAAFERLDLQYVPSAGNFILLDLKTDANAVYEALLRRGVIARPVGAYQLPTHIRVSIGLESENQQFIQALENVMQEVSHAV